jgi:hypothetical protein
MRFPVAILLAAGLIGCSHPAPKPPPPTVAFVPPKPVPPSERAAMCVRPLEKAAFDVAALKSQLMVTAISCQSEDKYNAFVNRYRSGLVGDEKSLNEFFGRAYGRRAQQAHDDYITKLANAQSQLGIQNGTEFCHLNTAMLDDVMALKSPTDLPTFAASRPIQQALAVEECPATPAPTKRAAAKPAPAHKAPAKPKT